MIAFPPRSGNVASCFFCTLLLIVLAATQLPALQRKDMRNRDPFVFYDAKSGKFYMTGTVGYFGGYDIAETSDPTLETWSEWKPAFRPPDGFWADRAFWAPEIHEYKGKYYMIGTGGSPIRPKGILILVSDSPGGPYVLHSPNSLTPPQYESLDGTLYVDKKGDPWLVYSREWTSVHDGQMRAFRLKEDLTGRLPGAQDILLFSASSAPWSASWGDKVRNWLTDGPQLLRLSDNNLVMAWSSNTILPEPIVWGYAVGLAYSASGEITGPWVQENRPLYNGYAGHGVLFRHPTEGLKLSVHQPQSHAPAYPLFIQVYEANGKLTVSDPKTPDYVLAYWRFEDLTPGRKVLPSIDILDVSPCANHLRATDYNTVGGSSSDVPAAVVPAMGRTNRVSYDSSQAPGAPAETCFLFSSNKSLNNAALKTWTLEASIKPARLGEYQTFLAKDAQDKTGDSVLRLGVTPDGHIEIRYTSLRGEAVSAVSATVTTPGKWYNTAATFDGREARLYIDKLDGKGYELECRVSAKSPALGKSPWTVGRGMKAGKPAEQFSGLIDEIRISRKALVPKSFLFYQPNNTDRRP